MSDPTTRASFLGQVLGNTVELRSEMGIVRIYDTNKYGQSYTEKRDLCITLGTSGNGHQEVKLSADDWRRVLPLVEAILGTESRGPR